MPNRINPAPILFACRGLDLNRPVDRLKELKYPILVNARSYQDGRIESRQGLTNKGQVVAGQSPVHSVRRLNDEANALYAWVIGTGTHLALGTAAPFTDADSGYSGDPLTLVPWRPDQSPEAWMYAADRSRMRKIRRSGTLHSIGVPIPPTPPTATLGSPAYTTIDDFEATTGWTQGGTAGAPALLSAGPGRRVNTTITAIVYDVSTTGWASVQPASIAGIGRGGFLTFNSGGGTAETVVVQNVLPQVTTTTISKILYDSGTTGDCSIYLAAGTYDIGRDSLILINSGGGSAERVRVKELIHGPDKTISIRVTTANNHVATESITGVPSFRVYLANNHAGAEAVQTDGMRSAVTSGTGTLSKTAAFDLSVLSGRPIQDDDEIHVSLRFDALTNLTEVKVEFDVDAATNDFTQNFYYFAARPSDLLPVAKGTLTRINAVQRAIQRSQVDRYDSQPTHSTGGSSYVRDIPRGTERLENVESRLEGQLEKQIGTGDNQWLELRFKVRQMTRVGSARSQTLRNVAAIRLSFQVTGNTNCDMDSWWVGGTYGPDIGELGEPYVYRYRGRVSATGANSGFGPPMRSGVSPRRQSVVVTLTQHTTTEVDKLDVYRFGGTLLEWVYVGTSANGATPTFTDNYPDEAIASNPRADLDHFQPWLVIDQPKSGTTGNVAGSSVTDGGTNFNTSWAPGTLIRINGVNYTLYRVISTSALEIYENAGSQGAVSWEMPEPKLMGQPLPILFGPFENFMFACGDNLNPGRLYFTEGNDPDGTREGYWIDVTNPSEPLMSGYVYNGRAYVFSSERMFAIYPAFGGVSFFTGAGEVVSGGARGEIFRVLEVPNSKGLFTRWGLAVGPKVWFLGRDGIYETTGGEPKSITNDDLFTWFPNEGNLGQTVNGYAPPNIVSAQATKLRLAYYDSYLYFDYIDNGGSQRTMVYQEGVGWFQDDYTPDIAIHYGEEGRNVHSLLCGGTNAILYQFSGTSDDGTAISGHIRTASLDFGDPRTGKFYGEFLIDADTQSTNLTITPGFDGHTTTLGPFTVSTASRARTLVDLATGAGQFGYNMSLDITWSSATVSPKLYWWEPHAELAPDSLVKWVSQPTTHDINGYQHLRDLYVALISSASVTLTINIDGTDYTYTIASTGGAQQKVYLVAKPVKGKVYRYYLTSASAFRVFERDCEVRVKGWGSPGPYQIAKPFGDPSRGEV